jgi:hypothetical protein
MQKSRHPLETNNLGIKMYLDYEGTYMLVGKVVAVR